MIFFKIIKAKRGKGLGILLAPYSMQFFRDLYFLGWCPLQIVLKRFSDLRFEKGKGIITLQISFHDFRYRASMDTILDEYFKLTQY